MNFSLCLFSQCLDCSPVDLILFLIYNYSQTNLNHAWSIYFRLVSSTVRPPALSALWCLSKVTVLMPELGEGGYRTIL